MNSRGLNQLMELFEGFKSQATTILSGTNFDLDSFVAIDGSLIDSALSIDWAEYRVDNKKAKVHDRQRNSLQGIYQ